MRRARSIGLCVLLGGIAVTAAVATSRPRAQQVEPDEAPPPAARSELGQFLQIYRAEKDDARRARLMREIGPAPGAPEALAKIVESDPSDDVALAAANAWRRIALGGVVRSLDLRLANERDVGRRQRLARETERYHVFALGQNLPHFMREAPPPFMVPASGAAKEATTADRRRAIRVLAFGDFGDRSEREARVAASIRRLHEKRRFDFAITLGDNFYPGGMSGPADPRWDDEVVRLYGPLRIPFFPSLGNHDWILTDSPAAEIAYSARSTLWRLPAVRYTFVAGPAQFFALDTDLITRAQLDWLDQELGRSTARWKIVYGHHPIHSDGMHGDEPIMRDAVLPLLRGRAQLYVCGHEHDLQHLVPDGGVHFVIAGGGGATPRLVNPGPRSLFAASRNGFAVIEASADTLAVTLVGDDLQVLHHFSLPERRP